MKTSSKILFRTVVVIFIVILVGLSAFSHFISYKKANFKAPPTIQTVSAIEVTSGTFNGKYQASGFIKSIESGDLYFLSSGKVEKIFVKPGDYVTKGQKIASLDTSAEEASINAQRANLSTLEQNYQGLKAVAQAGGASSLQVNQALAQLNQLKSSIKAAQEQLKNKVVYAPYDGIVGTINVNIGNVVSSSTKVATVSSQESDKDLKFVNVSISPDVLQKLSVGNQVTAFDKNDKPLAVGSITSIDESINLETGTSSLRVTFDNKQSQELHNGQFVKLSINANPIPNQITIPEVALVYTLYGQTVYVLEPLTEKDKESLKALTANISDENAKQEFFNGIYKTKETFIKANDHTNDVALVTEGLKVGDIIVTNYNQISDGLYVKIVPGYGITIPETFKLVSSVQGTSQPLATTNQVEANEKANVQEKDK